MLKPDYFTHKADKLIDIYRKLENYILKDIAIRLLKSGEVAGTTDRMIYILKVLGLSKSAIMAKLVEYTKMSRKELKSLLQNAVLTSWEDDLSTFKTIGIEIPNPLENQRFIEVIDAEWKKTQGELDNLTRTTIDQSQKDLLNMLNEADIRIGFGVSSYSQEVCNILDNYAKKGIELNYPTGATRTLESAVRMCVVTSMNQTAAQLTNQYIIEAGAEYVRTSAHYGARPRKKGQPYLAGHEDWQGKVYKIRGSEPGYPNLLEKTGYDIDPDTGVGTVVNPLGLHGYGCRHSHQPWDKRLRNDYVDEEGNLKIDSQENKLRYQNEQKQRGMERAIRKTKRELLVKEVEMQHIAETDVSAILQEQYDALAYRLRQQNKKYNQFCEDNNLQKQSDRLKVAGFQRKQASKANGRATSYSKKIEKEE